MKKTNSRTVSREEDIMTEIIKSEPKEATVSIEYHKGAGFKGLEGSKENKSNEKLHQKGNKVTMEVEDKINLEEKADHMTVVLANVCW